MKHKPRVGCSRRTGRIYVYTKSEVKYVPTGDTSVKASGQLTIKVKGKKTVVTGDCLVAATIHLLRYAEAGESVKVRLQDGKTYLLEAREVPE